MWEYRCLEDPTFSAEVGWLDGRDASEPGLGLLEALSTSSEAVPVVLHILSLRKQTHPWVLSTCPRVRGQPPVQAVGPSRPAPCRRGQQCWPSPAQGNWRCRQGPHSGSLPPHPFAQHKTLGPGSRAFPPAQAKPGEKPCRWQDTIAKPNQAPAQTQCLVLQLSQHQNCAWPQPTLRNTERIR